MGVLVGCREINEDAAPGARSGRTPTFATVTLDAVPPSFAVLWIVILSCLESCIGRCVYFFQEVLRLLL